VPYGIYGCVFVVYCRCRRGEDPAWTFLSYLHLPVISALWLGVTL
jgi:hypothetical protein